MRDCFCERPECRLCDLYHNDPTYQKHWDAVAAKDDRPPALVRFALALAEESKWRAGGGRGPTDEEKQHRRAACNSCPARDASNDSCSLCGCYLEARVIPPIPFGKLDCATQVCPKGLWGTVGGYIPSRKCGGCGSGSNG